ncbi:hypothetical protein FPV67DRAFT_1668042 [Lyophyllum atratum]|nr:hypothetical protein FPV67DRAFT_1668042 [Lyophyllum atratum]
MSGMPEPEPLSAYARWKIENDERFYATFPQARYAAHDYNTVSSAYWDGTGYYYNTDAHVATHPGLTRTSSVSPSSFASYEDVPTSQPLQHPHYNHNDYFSHESAQPSVPVSTAHDSYPRSSHEHPSSTRYDMTGLDSVYRPTDLPPTEVIHTNIVVPSQQPESCKVEPPLMDHLPPPDSPTPSTSSHIPTLHDTENKHNYYHQSHPYAQAVKTEPSALVPLDHYASHPPISRHPNPSYNYYPVHNPQPPPAGWPTVRAPSPRGIRLSPLPPSRRPHSKKPPLACIFCRGRKIACGPPDSGSSDRSCK